MHETILKLIADLYGQIVGLQQENDSLRAQLAKLQKPTAQVVEVPAGDSA